MLQLWKRQASQGLDTCFGQLACIGYVKFDQRKRRMGSGGRQRACQLAVRYNEWKTCKQFIFDRHFLDSRLALQKTDEFDIAREGMGTLFWLEVQ